MTHPLLNLRRSRLLCDAAHAYPWQRERDLPHLVGRLYPPNESLPKLMALEDAHQALRKAQDYHYDVALHIQLLCGCLKEYALLLSPEALFSDARGEGQSRSSEPLAPFVSTPPSCLLGQEGLNPPHVPS